MSKGTTGHGQHKCGTYRCKGGCEKSRPQKTLMAEHYETRPTAKEYQDPVKNELAELIGINEGEKEKLLSLFERLYSSTQLTSSFKYASKEDLREAIKNTDHGIMKLSEEKPFVLKYQDPMSDSCIIYDLNNKTKTSKTKYGDNLTKNKDLLKEVVREFQTSLENKYRNKDRSVSERIGDIYSETFEHRDQLNKKKRERFENRKEQKYQSLKSNEPVSYNDFIDHLIVLQEQGKVSGCNGSKGSFGATINDKCSIFASPDYNTEKHFLTVKDFSQENWVILPMNKGNIESIINNPSVDTISKIKGARIVKTVPHTIEED